MFFSFDNCTQGFHLPITGPLGSPTRFFLESFRVALGFAGSRWPQGWAQRVMRGGFEYMLQLFVIVFGPCLGQLLDDLRVPFSVFGLLLVGFLRMRKLAYRSLRHEAFISQPALHSITVQHRLQRLNRIAWIAWFPWNGTYIKIFRF